MKSTKLTIMRQTPGRRPRRERVTVDYFRSDRVVITLADGDELVFPAAKLQESVESRDPVEAVPQVAW